MKRILSVIVLLAIVATASAGANADFGDAKWIGAITKRDARIPQGRSYGGGKLKGDALARWAAVDSLSQRSIVLEKEFTPRYGRKRVKRATVYVCGLGFYELSLNGRKVGDAVLAPHWSDYDRTVFYNEYDVSDLCRGASTSKSVRCSVLLGNGFYNEQGGRYAKMRISFGPPTLLLRLHLEYTNGKSEDVVSDASWRYSLSAITFNSIYGGEDYDARWQPSWRPVVVQEPPLGELRRQIAEPVKVMERYDVKERLPHGVYDMGQNLAGVPEVTVRGQAGQTVKLTVGETLDKDGHVNQRQSGRPHYYIYTLKGEGDETWHPRFTYYGFRYVEVETEAELVGLRSLFVYNSARKTGHFECSNPLLNGAYRLIDRAVRSNWQAVWTDCPHREKLGWLEQDWLNGEGLMASYDCRTMIEQTMRQMADAQHADGSMPEIAPEYTVFEGSWAKPFLESPEWGGALVALPLNYYRQYGDERLIRQYYSQLTRYVDYLHTQDSAYILNQGLGDWYDYRAGEKAGFAKNTSVSFVSTAHFYQWTSQLATMAGIVGQAADAQRYAQRADSIRAAIYRHFYHADDYTFDTGSQCAQSIAIAMGLANDSTDNNLDGAYSALLADISAHGDRLTTGDVGTRYLLLALSRTPRQDCHEALYRLLNHYDVPGYGYQIKLGHTTLTEQWDPAQGASMNHFMMGHLGNLLIPRYLGIEVCEGGGPIAIAPMPAGDLTWARGYTECSHGRVSAEWRIDGDRFLLDLDLPSGAKALVTLPYSQESIAVDSGGHHHFEDRHNGSPVR